MPKVSELTATPAFTPGDLVYVVTDGVSAKLAGLKVATIADMQAILAPVAGMVVEVTAEGVGGTFVFSGTGASDGGTAFAANDLTAGAWLRRYSGPVDLAWFGGGGADDQAAWEAALSVGKEVVFSGDSLVLSTVTLPAGTAIRGVGNARLIQTTGQNYPALKASSVAGIVLQNFSVDGRGAEYGQAAEGPGLFFNACTDISLTRVNVGGYIAPAPFLTNKVRPIHFENCQRVSVTDGQFINCGFRGLSFTDGNDIQVSNNYIKGCANTAIQFRGENSTIKRIVCSGNICEDTFSGNQAFDGVIDIYQNAEQVVITGNLVRSFGNATLKTGEADGSGIRVTSTRHFVIANNVVEKPADSGNYNHSAAGITVTTRTLTGDLGSTRDGVLQGNVVKVKDGSIDYGLRISGTGIDNIIVQGNTCRADSGHAFTWGAQGDVTNWQIANNVFENFGIGLRLQGMVRGTITGNTFLTGTRGIVNITGTYDDITVANNHFEGMTERCIDLTTSVIGAASLLGNRAVNNGVSARGFGVAATKLLITGNQLDDHSVAGIDVLSSTDALISGNELDGCDLRLQSGNTRAYVFGNKVSSGAIVVTATSNTANAIANNDLRNSGSISDTGTSTVSSGNLT